MLHVLGLLCAHTPTRAQTSEPCTPHGINPQEDTPGPPRWACLDTDRASHKAQIIVQHLLSASHQETNVYTYTSGHPELVRPNHVTSNIYTSIRNIKYKFIIKLIL